MTANDVRAERTLFCPECGQCQGVGRGGQRLARIEGGEGAAGGGTADGDLKPALLAVEGDDAEVEFDGEQAVDHGDVIHGNDRADHVWARDGVL